MDIVWITIICFGSACWAMFGVCWIWKHIKKSNLKKSCMKRKHRGCFNCNNCIDAYNGEPKYFKCRVAGRDYSLVEGAYTDYEYCRDVVGKFNCRWAAKDASEEF